MKNESIYKQINDATVRDIPDVSLHEYIAQTCREFPGEIASLDADSQQTYAQLEEKSDQLATWLTSKGIGRGDRVGLCCERDVDTPALLLGILKSGAAYVPLDPDYPVDRLIYMVEDSNVKHVVAHSGQLELTEQFNVPATIVDRDWDEVVAIDQTTEATSNIIDPQSDVAYVIYTSGSTGKPKGVVVQHRAAVNFLCSMTELPGFKAGERILATTTLSFDISVVEIFLPLISGGSVAVVDRQTAKDTTSLVAAIEKFDVRSCRPLLRCGE